MASFKKNDEAVSAVIGVILMVAITVILAAVIAAFVFQLGGNVPKSKQVGVEVKRTLSDGFISVKTMSGADVGLLRWGDVSGNNATYTIVVNGVAQTTPVALPGQTAPVNWNGNSVGQTLFFGAGTGANKVPANADVTVVAHFTDGTEFPAWSGNLA